MRFRCVNAVPPGTFYVTFPRSAELLGMPIADQSEDARIVQRVRAGDVEAFALLVDRHHARCLRVATHLLSDADDAEDAVQEAFVRAYRHLGSYRERDRFGAWLLRVVVNQCRTHAAKHRRWTSSPNIAATDLLANDAGRDAAEAQATREELAHALAQLEPAQREAVVLRFADELSYDEMANITGVGVSALKMRVQRACARLRALLSEHFHA
jgi:RNA polymerase sigma-70 factor (ECF subfamily)